MPRASVFTPEKFSTFGELLRFLRRKADLTQRELAIAVGYSESQISRLEQNERAPEEATLAARFVTALFIEDEPEWVARLLELGTATHAHTSEADSLLPAAEVKPALHNLPIQLTNFIGREKEIAEIKGHLSKARLVTLTGSGGIGKTRLSIQAAREVLSEYPHGAWLVELAPLTDPALVLQAVCAVLDVQPQGNIPLLTALTDDLREKTLLLVLDNCEHLIDACAKLAEHLLTHCPDVCLLASSREALGIEGETAVRVPSLSLPDVWAGLRPAPTITVSEAVQLFVERASAALPGFALTDANAPAIAQVCRRLDGIALAIELAAARVKMLKVEQIAARLDDAFSLLTGGSRTALPHQQTVRATIDWSYSLLSNSERVLLRRLSVFAGGWTLEAAESVCGGEGVDKHEVLDVLTQLANKSLVVVEREQGEEARYFLLETTRQYAREKLQESGEWESLARQHAQYYLALIEANAHVGVDANWDNWWDDRNRYQAELDNLRAALTWSNSTTGSAELGLRLASQMWDGLVVDGNEKIGWLERALTHAEADGVNNPQALARVFYGLSMMQINSDFIIGEAWTIKSLKLFQELGDRRSSAEVIDTLGWLAREQGDAATARLRLQENLALWRELGDQKRIAGALITLGEVAVMQEDAVQATALIEEGLALSRRLGDDFDHIGWGLNHLGHVALLQGEVERAVRLQEESLAFFRGKYQDGYVVPNVRFDLGEAALAGGGAALAAKCFSESLTVFRRWQQPKFQSWCLAGLAGVAAVNEEPERAVWLWGAAEALRQSTGARPAPATRATHERLQAEVRAQLGEDVFNAKWTEGQSASVEQAIDEALTAT